MAHWMNDSEGTFEAALAGNACYICGSVVHVPDPKTGICPRDADWEHQAQESADAAAKRVGSGHEEEPSLGGPSGWCPTCGWLDHQDHVDPKWHPEVFW